MQRVVVGTATPTGSTMLPPLRTTAENSVQSQASPGPRMGQGDSPSPTAQRPVSTMPTKRRRSAEDSRDERTVRSRSSEAHLPAMQELQRRPAVAAGVDLEPNQRSILAAMAERPGVFLTSHDLAAVTSLSVKDVGGALATMRRRTDCSGLLELKMYGNKVRGFRINPSWSQSGVGTPAPGTLPVEGRSLSSGTGDTKTSPQLHDLSGMIHRLMADTQRLLREAEYCGRIGRTVYQEGVLALTQQQPAELPRTGTDLS